MDAIYIVRTVPRRQPSGHVGVERERHQELQPYLHGFGPGFGLVVLVAEKKKKKGRKKKIELINEHQKTMLL